MRNRLRLWLNSVVGDTFDAEFAAMGVFCKINYFEMSWPVCGAFI